MATNLIQAVQDDLDMRNVSPAAIQKASGLVRRALVKLHTDGALPPRKWEFKAETKKEEKRDGNGNLIYNFVFLPDDFLRLDKFTVYNVDTDDNKDEKTYQRISTDMLLAKRQDSDDRNFFSIVDYNIDDERTRKILVLDPYPKDDEYIEVRYFEDGTDTSIENIHERYWEAVIAKVHEFLGIKTKEEADKEISEESANWRNQHGKDAFNDTLIRTTVRYPFGKTQ